MDLLGNSKNW